jgi:hypothetical protein
VLARASSSFVDWTGRDINCEMQKKKEYDPKQTGQGLDLSGVRVLMNRAMNLQVL